MLWAARSTPAQPLLTAAPARLRRRSCSFEVIFPRQLSDQQKAALRQVLPTQ